MVTFDDDLANEAVGGEDVFACGDEVISLGSVLLMRVMMHEHECLRTAYGKALGEEPTEGEIVQTVSVNSPEVFKADVSGERAVGRDVGLALVGDDRANRTEGGLKGVGFKVGQALKRCEILVEGIEDILGNFVFSVGQLNLSGLRVLECV